jgi:hypothetical protein
MISRRVWRTKKRYFSGSLLMKTIDSFARQSRMSSHRQSECSRMAAGNAGVAAGLTVDQPRQGDYSGKNSGKILSWQCERFCRGDASRGRKFGISKLILDDLER